LSHIASSYYELVNPCFLLTTSSSARTNCSGNDLFLFRARLKIPSQARALKKYLCGTSVSSTCDNEHSTAALGDSEILAVQHSPGDPVGIGSPAHKSRAFPSSIRNCRYTSGKSANNDRKVDAVIGAEKAGDVFHHDPARMKLSNDTMKFVPESGPFSIQTFTISGSADILTGESPANNVNCLKLFDIPHILMFYYIRPMIIEHVSALFIDLDLPRAGHASALEAEIKAADTRKKRSEFHAASSPAFIAITTSFRLPSHRHPAAPQ
jgi:hypothetical protein